MRVLFTGGGGAGTQALWDLLEGRYEVHFCDPDPRRISSVVPDDRAHADDDPQHGEGGPEFVALEGTQGESEGGEGRHGSAGLSGAWARKWASCSRASRRSSTGVSLRTVPSRMTRQRLL